MNKELGQQADDLWTRSDKAYKFNSQFNVFPTQEGIRLVEEFKRLSADIPETPSPGNLEQVHHNELKRRLDGEAVYLEHALSGHYYTFEDVISLYGIDQEDTDSLRGWLLENREGVLDSIDRVYTATDVDELRLPVPADVPTFRRQAEEFSATHISNYQKKLAKLFEDLTQVGTFLRDINCQPTTNGRSYFNLYTKMLALGIPDICYTTEDQSLHINERELIRLFGHEGMGHGLNAVVTEQSDLPRFIKRNSESTRATVESVAQHFETVIFDSLAKSPKTQEDLGIAHKFGDLYQAEQDTRLINQYQRRLFQYAISVLADKSLGDLGHPETRRAATERRISLISDVALYPGYAVGFVEGNQQNFDSQGNLSFNLVSEMVYAAKPAQKVVEHAIQSGMKYEGDERGEIDMLLLSGFWTPIGLVENALVTVDARKDSVSRNNS